MVSIGLLEAKTYLSKLHTWEQEFSPSKPNRVWVCSEKIRRYCLKRLQPRAHLTLGFFALFSATPKKSSKTRFRNSAPSGEQDLAHAAELDLDMICFEFVFDLLTILGILVVEPSPLGSVTNGAHRLHPKTISAWISQRAGLRRRRVQKGFI